MANVEQPKMNCPGCNKEYDDFDGFGVLYCPPPDGCGYCRHAALSRKEHEGKTIMICDFCGHEKPTTTGGDGVVAVAVFVDGDFQEGASRTFTGKAAAEGFADGLTVGADIFCAGSCYGYLIPDDEEAMRMRTPTASAAGG